MIVSVDRIHAADGIRAAVLWITVMLLAECDHKFEEFKEILVFVEHTPVEPGRSCCPDSSCCCFRIWYFQIHRRQRNIGVPRLHIRTAQAFADHAAAKCENFRIIGFTFGTTVPAAVVIGTVCVVPAVCFIVLVIVSI